MTEETKNPVGRPSKYDPLYCERVIQLGADGNSKEAIAVELNPVESVLGAGTTIAVRIAADRRGDHFDLEVRADSTSTRAIAKINGAVVHERTFQAPRWTEATLLSESLEFGEVDPLSPAILRTMSALIG